MRRELAGYASAITNIAALHSRPSPDRADGQPARSRPLIDIVSSGRPARREHRRQPCLRDDTAYGMLGVPEHLPATGQPSF